MKALAARPTDHRRVAAVLLLTEGLIFFIPLAILAVSIDWPASLGDPAAVVLPRLLENEAAVRLGYTAYLGYSVLFLPVAVWTTRALTGDDDGPLARAAIGFAIASTLARSIGILRWLTVMPVLAQAYRDAPDDAARAALATQYDLINSYGGGIGELLGVSLFAAGWLGCTVAAARRAGGGPGWLLGGGGVAAIALALVLVELAGMDAATLIPVSTTLLQVWFLAAGATLLRRPAGRP